jgi:hypothetical protein
VDHLRWQVLVCEPAGIGTQQLCGVVHGFLPRASCGDLMMELSPRSALLYGNRNMAAAMRSCSAGHHAGRGSKSSRASQTPL